MGARTWGAARHEGEVGLKPRESPSAGRIVRYYERLTRLAEFSESVCVSCAKHGTHYKHLASIASLSACAYTVIRVNQKCYFWRLYHDITVKQPLFLVVAQKTAKATVAVY